MATHIKLITTSDGKYVSIGARVFNYYDRKWGKITTEPDMSGWFDVRHDDGTRACLNGDRISTYEPPVIR